MSEHTQCPKSGFALVARANAYANGKGEDLDRLLHSEGPVEPQQKEGNTNV